MPVIFVPVADRPECAIALRAAFDLGERLEANVIGCHMRPHRASKVSLSSDFGARYLDRHSEVADEAWRKKHHIKAGDAARALYARMAEKHGFAFIRKPRLKPGAIWQEKVGSPGRLIHIMGPVSDLLVVSRPAATGGDIARAFLMSALMESSRPVLVLPQRGFRKIGRRVCIGWNQGEEAARAVTASMPVLQRAEKVTIVSCGPEDRLGPKSGQLADYLRSWGIDADRLATRGRNVEKELLEAYRKTQSDVLVMGAYSRTRWREHVFGGTSEFMLSRAKIPVLMLHS